MKSTRMVCSLVVLSSPLCIDAAASGNSCWEVEVVKESSLLRWESAKTALKPTAATLERLEKSKFNIPDSVKFNNMNAFKELKNNRPPLNPKDARRISPTTGAPKYMPKTTTHLDLATNNEPINKPQLPADVLKEISSPAKPLNSSAIVYNSNGEPISINAHKQFRSRATGTVLSGQSYIWTPKEIASGTKTQTVWRPKLALIPAETIPFATTVTAMNNILAASVIESSFFGLSTQTMFPQAAALEVLATDPSNRTAKDDALFAAQCAELSQKATRILAKIGLSPRLGYCVRAVLDEFRNYSEENDEIVQTSSDIFKSAFGTTAMVNNNRPAVVALYAEVAGAVQDPYATGAWSYLGTNEPREVTELNACNADLKNETNSERKAALLARRDTLINAIHAEAVAGLNALVKQENITTDKLRAETKQADSQIAELRDTLRQLNELQTLQAVLNDREHHAAPSSSCC